MFTDKQTAVFLDHEIKRAKDNGVVCDFPHEPHVISPSTGTDVNGYFVDMPYRKLSVATGKPLERWLPIAVRLFCQMDQLLEQSMYWDDRIVPGFNTEARTILQMFDRRIIDLTPSQLLEHTQRVRNVELDCARRAVEKIKQFALPLSLSEFVKKTNSYLYFFTAMRELRRWYLPGCEPYNVRAVWSIAPDTLQDEEEYDLPVPHKLLLAYYDITEVCRGR